MILTMWEIEGTDEFAEWYDGCSDEDYVDELRREGLLR